MYEEINNIKNDYLKVRNFCKESYMYPKKNKKMKNLVRFLKELERSLLNKDFLYEFIKFLT